MLWIRPLSKCPFVSGHRYIAQALRQEGLQQGLKQGKAEGRQEGKREGIQEGMQKGKIEGEKQASMKIARQMLESGMNKQSVMKFTGLNDAEMSNLFKD